MSAPTEELTLKWGTLKGWECGDNAAMRSLMTEYVSLGVSFGAATQRDTPRQKEILHELIDDANAPLDPDVRPRIAAGKSITAQGYIEALQAREAMKLQFAMALAGIDALLTPTTMTSALPLEEVDQTKAPAHYTRFGNFLDLCAVSLPNGFAGNGLPTSLQIICRGYDEAMALRIGWAYQDATDWHLRRPPE